MKWFHEFSSTLLFLVGVTGSRCSLEILTTLSVSCRKTEHIPPFVKEEEEEKKKTSKNKTLFFPWTKHHIPESLSLNKQSCLWIIKLNGINLITTWTHLIYCQNQPQASQHNRGYANPKPTCFCL